LASNRDTRILVVDDSPVIRSKLEEILTGADYNVKTAPDGIQGLELIHDEEFDLLFLDIDMPNLSGLQVCRMLRNEQQFADFPIIMLTARTEKKDEYWGIETGASAYMKKPFDPEELLQKVQDVLDSSPSAQPGAAALPDLEVEEDKDVIFKAGEIQEIKLFKMSLTNKIFQIATSQFGLQETCERISEIFSAVIEFDLATFLISDEEQIKLYVFVNKTITRNFFNEVRKSLLNEFIELTDKKNIQMDEVEVDLNDPGNNLLKEGGHDKIGTMRTVPLDSTGETFGLFNMARGKKGSFSDSEIDMCNTIAAQSALVLNNVRMYEKIKRFAIADGLTGLHNHRYFQEQLEKEYSRARRFNLSLAMIMLDLDDFKTINDTYGHQQGDIILKDVGMLMKRSVRDIDLVARYGGEEFSVILPETPKKNAIVVAERIRQAINDHQFHLDSGPIEVTASLGVSGHPDDDINNKVDLIAKADEALYAAKRNGKNRVSLYASERSNF